MKTSHLLAATFVVGAIVNNSCYASQTTADAVCCATPATPVCVVAIEPIDDSPKEPSWIFAPSTYTHDPNTGARVAQYERKAPVEPLEDPRNVTSRYRRTQTVLRGPDGSSDVYYQVQAVGNGRGGLDAEWERFHDAWKESVLSGGYYEGPANGGGWRGNRGWNNGGWNGGWNGGGSWNNGGGWGGPGPGPGNGGWNGPPNGGGGWHGNGPPGNWQQNQSQHDNDY